MSNEDAAQLLLNLLRMRVPFSDPNWNKLDEWALAVLKRGRAGR